MAAVAQGTPTIDRGFVVVRSGPEGYTVILCAQVEGGRPVRPFAVHWRCGAVDVAPGVELKSGGGSAWSVEVVETFRDPASKRLRIQPVSAIEDLSGLLRGAL